ncbi:MAG: hypothetical protein R3C54_02165 [Parvularculaceae bacterium]
MVAAITIRAQRVVAAAEFVTRIDASGARGLNVNAVRIDGGGPNVPDKAVARSNVRVEQPEDADWFMGEAEKLIAGSARADMARDHGGWPPAEIDDAGA